ncbi:MAG TPA: nitronate monooxygenase, partial [Gammaproteobacteria bacterium]|nr:nitronate monooxygenase [Gammaproteobacteria bacterium]
METAFTRHAGAQVPLICGPMYPCSNPELVAAVSEAGGLGVVQPISLTYVHGHEFRAGLEYIRSLTAKPIGFNALIEASNKAYLDRMRRWIDVALEEGVRFFITSLGNPKWVCERVHAVGGVVYHDVTERKWAQKGIDGGVDGLIAVNSRAGGHAGGLSPEALFEQLAPLGKPIVSAGGVGTPAEFARQLHLGYAAVQLGTRFIATPECKASDAYKQAIVDAGEGDIVLTERLTGVPVAVIRNAHVERLGT